MTTTAIARSLNQLSTASLPAIAALSIGAGTVRGQGIDNHEPQTSSFNRWVELTPCPSQGKELVESWADYSAYLHKNRPVELSVIPTDLNAPLFASLRFGWADQTTLSKLTEEQLREDSDRAMGQLWFILDSDIDSRPRLFVDADRDGKINAGDEVRYVSEEKTTANGDCYTRFSTSVTIQIGSQDDFSRGTVDLYWYDKRGLALRDSEPTIEVSRNYALRGILPLQSGPLEVVLDDQALMGDFRGYPVGESAYTTLRLDRNGNKFFDSRGEEFDTRQPFTIDGTTYRIFDMSASGRRFRIQEVAESVPEIPPSPNLEKGMKIPSFQATTAEGKTISFPSDFAGKVIFFDIWASWCGPCLGELPFQRAAYQALKTDNLVMISLSIDKPKTHEKMLRTVDEYQMEWIQINDPGGWQGELFQLFATPGIPAGFVVDGSSGEILSSAPEVRGEALLPTLRHILEVREEKK